MHEAVAAPAPLSAPRSATATWSLPRLALLLAAAASVGLLLTNVFRRESYTGDEGFYGVTALNMARSADYLLRPSYFPAGDFLADRAGFAHPPFNSYLYALGFWAGRGSLAGPEIVHALAWAALLFFAYRLLALADRTAAAAAVLLLSASPAMLASYSLLEAEPLMTTAGLAGLYCCVRGGTWRWFFLGGLGLGLAFAFKLWLCGPLALAAAAAVAFSGRTLRDKARAFAACLVGGLIPSALHLLAVQAWRPEDLGFWLKEIYLGVFTSAGISGSKLSGASTPAEWVHPVWYYAAALYRDHFFLVPIVLFGSGSLLSDARLRKPLLCTLVAGASGLAPLSLVQVKEPLYVLACAVFIYLLAGCSVAAMLRRLQTVGKLDALSFKLGTAATALLLLAILAARAAHVKPEDITRTFTLVHTLTLGTLLAVIAWSHRRSRPAVLERALLAASALAIGATFAHAWATRSTRDAAIARVVMPYLWDNAPSSLSFVASNFKSYQLLTFRRGCYWRELPLRDAAPATLLDSEPFQTVRVFIVDPLDQRKPELAPWLRWLEANTSEKTIGGIRVFMRE